MSNDSNLLRFPERDLDEPVMVSPDISAANLSARRLGRFIVEGEHVREGWFNLLAIFCHVVVIETHYDRQADRFEYLGYSLKFPEHVAGSEIPEFRVTTRRFRGQISATFEPVA